MKPASFARIAIVLLLCAVSVNAQTPGTQPAGKTVRVLSIGNSFSANANAYLRQMVEAGGHKWVFGHAMIGGSSFAVHMKGVKAFEANPEDPAGKPYKVTVDGKPKPISLRQLLESQPWEYVTIQQASFLSYKPETFEPYAGQLIAYVRRHAPQAKLLIHETWAYRADHTSFKDGFDQQQMYRRLHDNYRWLADYYGAVGVIPVGSAFQNVREDARWKPSILPVDLSMFKHPALPPDDPDLNVGYSWNTRVTPYKIQLDRGHASAIGRYLGGCVWYEFFFGDVRENTYRPKGISGENAALMREIAHKTVAEGLVPKAASVAIKAIAPPSTQPLPQETSPLPPAPGGDN